MAPVRNPHEFWCGSVEAVPRRPALASSVAGGDVCGQRWDGAAAEFRSAWFPGSKSPDWRRRFYGANGGQLGRVTNVVLTLEEEVAALQTGRTATHEAYRSGPLPGFKVGRKLRFSREAVRRLAEGSGPKESAVSTPHAGPQRGPAGG